MILAGCYILKQLSVYWHVKNSSLPDVGCYFRNVFFCKHPEITEQEQFLFQDLLKLHLLKQQLFNCHIRKKLFRPPYNVKINEELRNLEN